VLQSPSPAPHNLRGDQNGSAPGSDPGLVLTASLQNLSAQEQQVLQQMAVTAQALQKAQSEEAKLKALLASLQAQDKQLQARSALDAQRITADRRALNNIARQQYTGSVAQWWAFILGSTDFNELLVRLDRASRIDSQLQVLLDDYSRDQADAQVTYEKDQTTEAAIAKVQIDLAAVEQQLQSELAQEQGLLERVRSDLKLAREVDLAMQHGSDLLTLLIAQPDPALAVLLVANQQRLDSSAAALPQLGTNSVDAKTPLIWPLAGEVTQEFGANPDNGYNGPAGHSGIDVAGPYGTAIYAAADGVVIFAGTEYAAGVIVGYGHLVVIQHASDVATLYGHLDHSVVQAGQFVHQGQLIAFEGSSGASTGPHCHFEVRMKGTQVNPRPFLPIPDNPTQVAPPGDLVTAVAQQSSSPVPTLSTPPPVPQIPGLPTPTPSPGPGQGR
jgi:murein DD-endopeptidase MepM/ murein hydrolase activator NlpD